MTNKPRKRVLTSMQDIKDEISLFIDSHFAYVKVRRYDLIDMPRFLRNLNNKTKLKKGELKKLFQEIKDERCKRT